MGVKGTGKGNAEDAEAGDRDLVQAYLQSSGWERRVEEAARQRARVMAARGPRQDGAGSRYGASSDPGRASGCRRAFIDTPKKRARRPGSAGARMQQARILRQQALHGSAGETSAADGVDPDPTADPDIAGDTLPQAAVVPQSSISSPESGPEQGPDPSRQSVRDPAPRNILQTVGNVSAGAAVGLAACVLVAVTVSIRDRLPAAAPAQVEMPLTGMAWTAGIPQSPPVSVRRAHAAPLPHPPQAMRPPGPAEPVPQIQTAAVRPDIADLSDRPTPLTGGRASAEAPAASDPARPRVQLIARLPANRGKATIPRAPLQNAARTGAPVAIPGRVVAPRPIAAPSEIEEPRTAAVERASPPRRAVTRGLPPVPTGDARATAPSVTPPVSPAVTTALFVQSSDPAPIAGPEAAAQMRAGPRDMPQRVAARVSPPATDIVPSVAGSATGPSRAPLRAVITVSPDSRMDAARLDRLGLDAAQVQLSPFALAATRVHYFHPQDAGRAHSLATRLGGAAIDMTGIVPAPPPGHLDIQIAG